MEPKFWRLGEEKEVIAAVEAEIALDSSRSVAAILGAVMHRIKGRANPVLARDLIVEGLRALNKSEA